MSESDREVRMRHEQARAAENIKGDRVESADRKAGRPEGPQSGCQQSREATVGEAAGLTYDQIYREVKNILAADAGTSSNDRIAKWIALNLIDLLRFTAAEAADRTVQVSTGPLQAVPGAGVRSFSTGATRSSSEGKPDYEGYFSPLVFERYGQFMLKHQVQPDGTYRPSDNWQKGIPIAEYLKSLFRHFVSAWTKHRGWNLDAKPEDFEDDLCAIIFNASGYLHEYLRGHRP